MSLHIAEYSSSSIDSPKSIPVVLMPELATQVLAVGATSVQSAAFQGGTRMIRLFADEPCRVLVGESPTAVATSTPLAEKGGEYFGVRPGDKLAVIAA